MRVLGISGRSRHAAAAIAVDGRVVAAVTEESIARVRNVGYAHTSGLPLGAVRACLTRAGLVAAAIDLVVVEGAADDDVDAIRARWQASPASAGVAALGSARHMAVDTLTALAAQALPLIGVGEAHVAVLDLENAGAGGRFLASGGRLCLEQAITGMSVLVGAAADVARVLGCGADGLTPLLALADAGKARYLPGLRDALQYQDGTVVGSAADLAAVIDAARGDAPGPLSDPSPLHVAVMRARAGLAASLIARLAEIAAEVVAAAGPHGQAIVSGGLFESAAIVDAVAARVGAVRVAAVPGRFGLAIGAAIAGSGQVPTSLPSALAIGPAFSEPDVKEVLDGCRLDYVYEPDWPRLLPRVSRMLTRGKQIGWFQGPMDFGPHSLGGRSILCDPSNRYARENINRFLRHRPDDQAPALVMLSGRTGECLERTVTTAHGLTTATVRQEWRLKLQAGVDASGRCRVHTVDAASSRLSELLAAHEALSGIPALVHVDLRGLDEPTACSPRDAIRTTFSSTVDALVIERFLLMKDYWLLRSATE